MRIRHRPGGPASPGLLRFSSPSVGNDAGFSDGALTPVVSTELPLADAPRAHKLIMEPGAKGKIVLTV